MIVHEPAEEVREALELGAAQGEFAVVELRPTRRRLSAGGTGGVGGQEGERPGAERGARADPDPEPTSGL